MLKVRRARADEFDQVLDFYTNMIDGMRGTEFDVCWEHDVHPSSAFLRASADAGEVYVLGSLPAYHGRGFARAMMEACIDVARAAGKRAVRLDTFTTNVRAQSLYESCGFANCGVCEGFYDRLGRSAVMYEYAV